MPDEPIFDFESWIPETGAGTGDARENDPAAAGFTGEQDRLYRSHFQHANQLADRSYEQVRVAYALGYRAGGDPRVGQRSFEQIETDLENGWLSVRTAAGDWASVRELVRTAFDNGRQGRMVDMPNSGSTGSHDRVPYADPVAGNLDPTSPESAENRLEPG